MTTDAERSTSLSITPRCSMISQVLLLHPNPSVHVPIGAVEMMHSVSEGFWVFGYADRSALLTDNENNSFYGFGMDLSTIEISYDSKRV